MNSLTRKTFLLLFLAVITLAVAGCAAAPRELAGPAVWSGLGVSVTVPEGTWRVEGQNDAEVVAFKSAEASGGLAVVRMNRNEMEPVRVAVQELFIAFREKHPLERWTLKTTSGRTVECASYLLVLERQRVHATACAVRHDADVLVVVAWGFPGGYLSSRRMAEQVVASLQFDEESAG